MADEPYENTLTLDELRAEVRRCWDLQFAVQNALRDVPEVPPYDVLLFLDRASKWPEDYNLGKRLQQRYRLEVIPPKTECECGAGVWWRIRQGLLMDRKTESNEIAQLRTAINETFREANTHLEKMMNALQEISDIIAEKKDGRLTS